MTRFKTFILAAALGGTALGGAAYAAQDQAAPPPPAGMHHHHRGHGDMFAKLDTNHDGVITRAEALAAADARFDKLDTNHDGKITQDEIQAHQQAMLAKWQQRRAAHAAQSGTDDGQPSADAGQHPGFGHMHGHGRPGHGDMMLKRLDANNDGVITKAEAEAAAMQRFDKLDTNHDGKIDQSEMAAAKAQMQQRRQAMRAKWQQRHAGQMPAPGAAAPADQPDGQ